MRTCVSHTLVGVLGGDYNTVVYYYCNMFSSEIGALLKNLLCRTISRRDIAAGADVMITGASAE